MADPERTAPQVVPRLARLVGLTDAEATVAAMLCVGRRAEEIAERRMVSMPTVRTQIRAVFDKTGTTRQRELVRLASRLPPAGPVST